MRRKTVGALAGLVFIASMPGCTYEPVSDGTVIDKNQSSYMILQDAGNSIKIPITYRSHNLVVEYKGYRDTWSVTDSVYDQCSVSDRIDRTEKGAVTCRKQ